MTATPLTHAEFKNLDSSDMEIIFFEYRDPESGHAECDIRNREILDESTFAGDPGRCACCGSRIKYAAGVHIKSLGYYVRIGLTCAERVENLRLGSNVNLSYLRDRSIAKKKEADFVAETGCGELIDWARSKDAHYIAADIASKLAKWGSISEKQIALIEKLKNDAETRTTRDAEFAPKAPAPEGRVEVTGTVLGFKTVEHDFGITQKMIVRVLDTFAKVYVTVPKVASGFIDRGTVVRFTASFQRSDTDEFFAFGKRPAKATCISQPAP
jgi:hypothetical protein